MMKAPGCKRCRRSRSLLMVTLLLTAVLLLSVLMLLQSPPNDTTKVAQAPGQAEEGGRNVGAFEAEMRRRVRRLSAHCRAMRTSGAMVRQKQGSKFANLFLLERRSLLWCPVFKAASTAWMENFFRLTGMAEDSETRKGNPIDHLKDALTVVGSSDEYVRQKSLHPDMKGFIVVRHPFHRLVSAFRDKLERLHMKNPAFFRDDYYYNLYGKGIVSAFRKLAVAKFGREAIYSKEHNYGAPLPVQTFPRLPALPTFWEFVQYVLRTQADPSGKRRHDEHWAPITSHCPVCGNSFDYVVRFESLDEEEPELESALGVRQELGGRLERMNANGGGVGREKVGERRRLPDEEVTRIYFETLDDDDVRGLYGIYEWDFRALGYEFEFRGMKFPPAAADDRRGQSSN